VIYHVLIAYQNILYLGTEVVFEKQNAKVEDRKGKKYSMRGGLVDFLCSSTTIAG
jgi:hypothetical protein